MDIQQILFTNLQLLGFDAFVMERKWRIPFNKEMFQLPNKKGFEAVVHFLFEKLNPTQCKEQFRDCWPVTDKKQEQDFRRVVNHWLTDIAKEPDSHFPRIVASVFLSPGGDKFNQLMFAFSRYVLYKNIINENGYKQKDFLRYPVITPQNQEMGSVLVQTVQCGGIRHRKQSLEHMQQAAVVQEEWKHFASELVKTHRSINKRIRDLERELKVEAQKSLERKSSTGSPVSHKRKSGIMDYDLDVQNVKRAQKVQEVRDLWKLIDNFSNSKATERQIMESILLGTLDHYKINAAELNIKVPDILLRECEKEIQRRGVENIYEGGKLNLLSLIHLWNLSLHLYIEKLHKAGVPEFEKDIPTINTQVHTHHAHLTSVQTLRAKLEKETIPELKESIRRLKEDLDEKVFTSLSPNSIRTTSLGFGLMPPTPPVSFDPTDAKTPSNMAVNMNPVPNTEQVNTPEAAMQLMDSINKRIVNSQSASPLIQGVPIYAARQELATRQRSKLPTAQYLRPLNAVMAELEARDAQYHKQPHPKVHRVRFTENPEYIRNSPVLHGDKRSPLGDGAELEKRGQKQSTRVKASAPSRIHKTQRTTISNSRSKGSGQNVKQTPSGTSLIQHDTRTENRAKQNLSSQVTGPGPRSDQEIFRQLAESTSIRQKQQMPASPSFQPVLEKHLDSSVLSSIPRSPSGAHDMLAERLVDDMMSFGSSPREVLGQAGPDDDLLTKDGFLKNDKLMRTPPQKATWHDNLLENSYGPLSSTRIDQSKANNVERGDRDKVATKLFSPEETDDDETIQQMGQHTASVRDQAISPNNPVIIPTRIRQETYGAELDEQHSVSGKLHREVLPSVDRVNERIPVDMKLHNSQEIFSPSVGKTNKEKFKKNKGLEDDPYGEHTLKYSLLSPSVSGIGLLSSSDSIERTRTPDLADIQQKLTFVTDATESYRLLSETATPTLPVRHRDRINKQLNMESDSLQSLRQSEKSASIPMQSLRNSNNFSSLAVTFGTPPDIDPTPSILVKEDGLRALDILSMSPTKGGEIEYNLGIFDLNLGGENLQMFPNTDISHTLSSGSKHSSQNDKTVTELFQLNLEEENEDQAQNHVKWRDLEQEIRNADKHFQDSQLTSINSDITEDNVRVIEFQNGSFKEFLEKSPDRLLKTQQKFSVDDSTSESSDNVSNKHKLYEEKSTGSTEYVEETSSYSHKSIGNRESSMQESSNETDSLIERYRKLRMTQSSSGNDEPGLVSTTAMDRVSPASSHQSYSNAQGQLVSLVSPFQSLQQHSINCDDNNLMSNSPFTATDSLYSQTKLKTHSPQYKDTSSDRNNFLLLEEQYMLHQQKKSDHKATKFTLDDFEFDGTSPPRETSLFNESGSVLSSIDDILGCGPLGERLGTMKPPSSNWNESPSAISRTKYDKGSPQGQILLNNLAMSPVTGALHKDQGLSQISTTNTKITPEKFPDIFGEDESLLVPPSPP